MITPAELSPDQLARAVTGAYDLLSNPRVAAEALVRAAGRSTAERCRDHQRVFVSIDGTSLAPTDRTGTKGFGAIGALTQGARGIKVINAYAIGEDGTPVGLLDQQWWVRKPGKKRNDCHRRPVEDKETKYWLQAIAASSQALVASGANGWLVIDREGDRYATLLALRESGQAFTLRSTYGHRFLEGERRNVRLRHKLARAPVKFEYQLKLKRRYDRAARTANMRVRATTVTLRILNTLTKQTETFGVNVVDAQEFGRRPRGQAPVHWRLFTNQPIRTQAQVHAVLASYKHRWKVEELHRTWKSGACRVEETQLRSAQAVMKWAVIMAATATRIERLKFIARNDPGRSASAEFSSSEINAAILLRRRSHGSKEPDRAATPSVGEFVLWIAELGGYTGPSSGGPPGSTTIRRGLEKIGPLAQGLDQLKLDGEL